jgi:uracil-DNA glycosylase
MPRASHHPPARDFIPPRPTLPALRAAAQACRACDLYQHATQAVVGEGPRHALLLFVGEQPGDQEDLAGRPFVGPAGRELDAALAEVGIPRGEIFVTNAVKHFKFELRGKRRIHQKPSVTEVRACLPWLETEIALVEPRGIVCLGATAAQALMGPKFRLTREHGNHFPTRFGAWLTATLHPSAILRAPDPDARRLAREQLLSDLRKVATRLRREKLLAKRAG